MVKDKNTISYQKNESKGMCVRMELINGKVFIKNYCIY